MTGVDLSWNWSGAISARFAAALIGLSCIAMLAACDGGLPWREAAGPKVCPDWGGPVAFRPVNLVDVEGVVADISIFPPHCEQYPGLKITAWQPTAGDIERLETGIAGYLRDNAHPMAPDQWRRLGDYRRQYFGEIRNGRRYVLVSLFPAHHQEWQSYVVFVLDGGPNYFRVEYDVDSGAFTNIDFNGSA